MHYEEIRYYECPQCQREYDDEHAAVTCCAIDCRTAYKCGECGAEYRYSYDAERCWYSHFEEEEA